MRMIIVSILWLICILSQVYGQGYPYPYNPILYEAFQQALISDVDNLIRLQSFLFPPGGASPVSISVSIDHCGFTVNNISQMGLDDTSPYTNCSSVRCGDNYGYCSRQDLQYAVSKDASSSSHDRLKQHINQQSMALILIDYISVYFFSKVTFSNLLSDDQAFSIDSDVFLTLHVSELPTMPNTLEVDATLSLLLSWVSIRTGSICMSIPLSYLLILSHRTSLHFYSYFGKDHLYNSLILVNFSPAQCTHRQAQIISTRTSKVTACKSIAYWLLYNLQYFLQLYCSRKLLKNQGIIQ